MSHPKPAYSLAELAPWRDPYTDSNGEEAANYNLGGGWGWQIGCIIGDITPGRWTAINRTWQEGEPEEITVYVYDEAATAGLDKYAYAITDAPGNLIGVGPTRELAIASAAEGTDVSFDEAERRVEETEDYAHSGTGYVEWEDRLCINTRAEWEEIAGMTLEDWHDEEAAE